MRRRNACIPLLPGRRFGAFIVRQRRKKSKCRGIASGSPAGKVLLAEKSESGQFFSRRKAPRTGSFRDESGSETVLFEKKRIFKLRETRI